MGNGRCTNWDSDWGACGRCAACVVDQSAQSQHDRLTEIERKLDTLLSVLTPAQPKDTDQPPVEGSLK